MSSGDNHSRGSEDEKELQGSSHGEPQESYGDQDNSNLYSSYGTGEFGSEHQFLHANLWESKQAALRMKLAKGDAEEEEDSF